MKDKPLLLVDPDDGVHGDEIWVSDGTPAGTFILKDINPGPGSSNSTEFVLLNDELYFVADNGTHGQQLWKSDGTTDGTVMVTDVNDGQFNPIDMSVAGNLLFFFANDGVNGQELWASDGTAAGTAMVLDLTPGAGSTFGPVTWTSSNGKFFFDAFVAGVGDELLSSDGTAAGTVVVKDIRPGPNGSNPSLITDVDGFVYFVANDGINGGQLWKTDGTEAGTEMVTTPGHFADNISFLYNFNGKLVFDAPLFAAGIHGQMQLYTTDGTDSGTTALTNVNSSSFQPQAFFAVDDLLYFTANDGTHGRELWVSDGTVVGTHMVLDINLSGSSSPSRFANVNGLLFFDAFNGTSNGVWATDGTVGGTFKLYDTPGGLSSTPIAGWLPDTNQPPVATDDGFSTFQSQPIAGDVLANDSDPDAGDALTAVLDTNVGNGTLTLNADGSFDYTPNAGFTGIDQFTYHANDGTTDGNVATVSINVQSAVLGTDGNDTLDGGAGAQTMIGGKGNDTYVINSVGDAVIEKSGEGNDTIWSRINNYKLADGSNVENLTLLAVVAGTGNSGDNVITGSNGANMLAGLGGADTLNGGQGSDTATYAASLAGVNVSLVNGTGSGGDAEGDVLISIENLIGSAFSDTLEGDVGDNVLNGGAGVDTVSYQNASDRVTVSLALTGQQDTGTQGHDTLVGFENLTGSAHDDVLTGNQLANVLIGGNGDDILIGGAGADVLIGGFGPISAPPGTGGPGPELAGSDTASYATSPGAINVNLTTGKGQGGDAKGDTLSGIENVTGSAFNDGLVGDENDNILFGGAGDDTLMGGVGFDTLEGGTGNNVLMGGDNLDTASYAHAGAGVTVNLTLATPQNTIGAGIDKLGSIENLAGSAYDDLLTGNQLANALIGGDGNDTLNGGGGNDTLTGGTGTNTFAFGIGFGQDTIMDFKLGQDIVQFAFPQAAKLVAAAAIVDDGVGDARLTINSANTITFANTTAADLQAHRSDFQFA